MHSDRNSFMPPWHYESTGEKIAVTSVLGLVQIRVREVMHVDDSYEKVISVLTDARSNIENIKTEEDAKFQIISRVLIEVLGWSHADISAEEPNLGGFSDYRVGAKEDIAFVVEAKKIGVIDFLSASEAQGNYKISGPVLKSALPAIRQVATYCQSYGAPLSVLTDGVIWIVFLPWVPRSNFMDRQAIVFPSFDAIEQQFSLFFELLSKKESLKNTFQIIFDKIHGSKLMNDQLLAAPFPLSENTLLAKSALAFDLENVFETFFAQLSGVNDPDMLGDCFVESRESILADFALERITSNVLGNINPNEKGIEAGLKDIVQSTVAGERGQTIFIVGPAGAGKSTFLDRFFKRTLPEHIRKVCVPIHVNVLNASSDVSAALPWITERSISLIEEQTYESGYPKWDDLLGLYHIEYVKKSEGEDSRLYKRDKEGFKDKFDLFLKDRVETDREGYLRRLLNDIVRNRKKLPVFIIDNTDEFEISWKTSVFQFFQSLRRSVDHCLLIFPATDRSAWTFAKTEIFNIYTSRSFFLPTPPPREVFRKRVEFIRSKLNRSNDQKRSVEYLVGRGIRLNVSDISAFASVIERVFVDNDYAAKRIGELANYNMRTTLSLSKRVVTSSALKVEDLIKSYITGAFVAPSIEIFHNALCRGDFRFFRAGDEPALFPIFQVDTVVSQTPLINLRLLDLLRSLHQKASEDNERYISVSSALSYFGNMGLGELSVQRSIEALLEAGLIEPYDMSKKEYSDSQRIAISFREESHHDLALFNPVYFEQMALVTRIVDAEIAGELRSLYADSQIKQNRSQLVRKQFAEYLIAEDKRHCNIPTRDSYKRQLELSDIITLQWQSLDKSTSDLLTLPDLAASKVSAFVQWFDRHKGFGFVSIPALKDNAFVHARVVEAAHLGELHDSDELICDVARNDRGLQISKIHNLVGHEVLSPLKAIIVKLLPDRAYGFVNIPQSRIDAFFHYNLFSAEERLTLRIGKELIVEIRTDEQGRSQVRRILAA